MTKTGSTNRKSCAPPLLPNLQLHDAAPYEQHDRARLWLGSPSGRRYSRSRSPPQAFLPAARARQPSLDPPPRIVRSPLSSPTRN